MGGSRGQRIPRIAPDMHPILFEIPLIDFPIRSFGVMVVLGFLAGTHWFSRMGERWAVDLEAERPGLESTPLWVLIGVIAGARLMYVAVEVLQGTPTGQGFVDDPFSVLFVHRGGLVMYGGAFGAILAGWWATRKHGLRVAHTVDLGLISGFLGLSIGRIGCLLVGDDFGSIVPERWEGLPFPITLRVPEVLPEQSLFGQDNAGQLLWCTQIWMSLNALMLAGIGRWLLSRRRFCGQVTLQVLLLYSFGRYAIESFRGDSIRGLWFGGAVSTSQLISIALGLCCLTLLVLLRGRTEDGAAPPARESKE